MLDERKKRVLQVIVEEYIKTAEPVSSNAIMNLEGLEYSSATIRNEMAELEKMGYLEKPHTSAGRIPSAKGYRYYVDELLQEDKITLEEIKTILSNKGETQVFEKKYKAFDAGKTDLNNHKEFIFIIETITFY